jgi:hypothetical protein
VPGLIIFLSPTVGVPKYRLWKILVAWASFIVSIRFDAAQSIKVPISVSALVLTDPSAIKNDQISAFGNQIIFILSAFLGDHFLLL